MFQFHNQSAANKALQLTSNTPLRSELTLFEWTLIFDRKKVSNEKRTTQNI